jgi:hypothetical protein
VLEWYARPVSGARQTLLRVALCAAVAWAANGFVRLVIAEHRQCAGPPVAAGALAWRLGSPEAERLASFLAEAKADLPAGEAVGFTAAGGQGEATLCRLWAAYLEPDLDFVALPNAAAFSHHILAFQERIDRPGLTLVGRFKEGFLYRIGPP